jgi:hypothetical protein
MVRTFVLTALAVGLLGTVAEAQLPVFVGAGSTWQGDYLRGVGIEAYGLGLYNEKTAIAGQINANTFMVLNEYFAAVSKNEGREHAERRRQELKDINERRKQIYDRIHDNPEMRDVFTGDALNVILSDVTNPKVDDSTSRYAQVPLDPGFIRQIPFKLGEKGETFSMNRLSMKKKWAVQFQNDRYKLLCKDYQRAVQKALDLAIDGKMKDEAIAAVEKAVDNLEDTLKRDPFLADPRNQRLYSEAKSQLETLRRTERLFKTTQMQPVFADIDIYSGTTVDELRVFMRRHRLSFADADSHDERDLYPKLYTALKLHRDKAGIPEKDGN